MRQPVMIFQQIAQAVQKAKIPCFASTLMCSPRWRDLNFLSGADGPIKFFWRGSVSDLTQRQIKKLRYEREVYIETLSAEG